MGLQPFDPDVLRPTITRITVGERIQIDPVASIILNARLISVSGQVTATVYTDREANYSADDAEASAASEEGLIAFAVLPGTSDAQSPLAPPTHFDYGVFVKAEGDVAGVALLELTYVHRVDYNRSFEPIQVSTWANPLPPLGEVLSLPDVPPWEEGENSPEPGDTKLNIEAGPLSQSVTVPENRIQLDISAWTLIEGGTFVVNAHLSSAPLGSVTVSITNESTDTTTNLAVLTFTPANYATPQPFIVTAVDDAAAEAEQSYRITLAVTAGDNQVYGPDRTDPVYLSVGIVDNDSTEYGMFLNIRDVVVLEDAPAETVEITLRSQPTDDVTLRLDAAAFGGIVEVSDDDITYAETVDFTFTAANWDSPQLAYIKAPDNSLEAAINPLTSTVALYVTATLDTNYAALTWYRVYLTVLVYDNDTTSIGSGILYLETEDQDVNFATPLIITESGDAFIRLE